MTENNPKSESLIANGTLIGRYVVLGPIARGGMGEVYAAHDFMLGRKLAIKLLRLERTVDAGDTEGKARFLREAQAIARLSHPNVVIIHDVGIFGDRVFIAMEFIEGKTLTYWLLEQPRTWREILRVFIAAGRGLQHAHDANLVHRDFKPENVMVRVDGQVRVTDFGVVSYGGAAETLPVPVPSPVDPEADADEGKLTETGVLMGTPAYMSPEQFRGQTVDARSDQFSFCVALYEALYGKRPFDATTVSALAICVLSGEIIPPPEGSPVPVMVWQAVRRGLSVDAGNRYPSMNELLAELARHAEPPSQKLPPTVTLISATDLAGPLETLLGRAVHAKPQEFPVPADRGVVAVYAGEDGAPGVLMHFDLLAAGSLAAALISAPADVVLKADRAGKLPQDLRDNLLEVANVLTTVVRGMSLARLRIQRIFALPGGAPADIVAALASPRRSVSFDVSVAEYPGGRVTFVGLEPRGAALPRQQERTLSRALIVDDSAAMRLVIGRALAHLGVTEVVEAANGHEGLKRLRRRSDIDAVFVDWSMPIMDGVTFIRAVRGDKRFDGVRLVMVTTEGDPAQTAAALAAGADEYLVKPLTEDVLRSKLAGIGLKTT